jgi:hypothetical protein
MPTVNNHWTTGLEEPGPDSDDAYCLPGVPVAVPPARDWRQRLERWAEVRRAPSFTERPEVAAGRRGEQSTRRWVGQHLRTNFGTVFGGKRVPRDMKAASLGRYEIDLVVVTPRRIVALETKNWSGRLRLDGDRWVHERRDGTVNVFDDLIARNRNKLRALRDYLAHSGLVLPLARFHHAVIFENPNLDLDDRLQMHPAVIVGRDVGVVLGRATSSMTYVLSKIIERCVGNDGARLWAEHVLDVISPGQQQATCAALSKLRTWDLLTLKGGRVLQGDLLWLRIGDETLDASIMARDSEMELRWRRTLTGLCFMLLTEGAVGRTSLSMSDDAGKCRLETVDLDTTDCLYFHEVGRPRPSVIAFSSIDRIRIG